MRRQQLYVLMCSVVPLGCGPETAGEALEKNVRTVCIMGRALCYEQGVTVEDAEEPIEMCVEALAVERGERARVMSQHCFEIYADFFACAAKWTCEEFLMIPSDPAVLDFPCMDYRAGLNRDCPGLSPLGDNDQLDEPQSP